MFSRGHGALDVLLGDDVGLVRTGVIIGLAQQIEDVGETGAEFVLAAGQTHPVFRHLSHRARIVGQQLVLVAHPLDELGVAAQVGGIIGHHRIEFGLDLENLAEIVVRRIKQLVEKGIPEHDDLDAEGNGLGLHRGHGQEQDRIIGIDLGLGVLEHALEHRPDPGLEQHIPGVQDQITAVGLQE
ncbi:MAG: hypothetical protein BWY77_01525 [bacterium ADurb.Bin431]|nr:MAG: hypothetical protein BWY77_01525 [bacterium ADurb.Bin431]